jgi:hypothetical protein
MDVGPTSSQGARAAAGTLAHQVIGRNPKTWAVIFIAMVVVLLIFVVLFIVYLNKYRDCEGAAKGSMLGTDPLGNLSTGGNNPMWQLQMGDAGWGGSMHSTYQKGQPRVWGASAVGGHEMAVVPRGSYNCRRGGIGPAAAGEAQALTAVQALDPNSGGSAKHMSDDALMRVMNGGSGY